MLKATTIFRYAVLFFAFIVTATTTSLPSAKAVTTNSNNKNINNGVAPTKIKPNGSTSCRSCSSSTTTTTTTTTTGSNSSRLSRFDKYVNKIFDEADTNHNGEIDMSETYELVLRVYVQLNRQAPIPPPSRSTVMKLYRAADGNRNRRISRNEFTQLATVLGRRALARLVAHKLVTLVGAPLLAELTLQRLTEWVWVHEWITMVVPKKCLPLVTNPAFGRTVLIVIFVASLGNIALSVVNWLLDIQLRGENHDMKKGWGQAGRRRRRR